MRIARLHILLGLLLGGLCFGATAHARDVDYKNGEVNVYVTPSEPTQIQFPGVISGGFKRKLSTLSLDRKDSDLVIFASEGISDTGEAIIVRLQDGRSYSIRIKRATTANPRDSLVRLEDDRTGVLSDDEEDPAYKEKKFDYAPPSQVSGLMREMVLAGEFGKLNITGYRVSDRYKGEIVLNDGTINATIDKIFIGPTLWGYVIDAENLLDAGQKINPASFRLDGTRAISADRWELAPKPLNIEQQLSKKDRAKIYIVTRAKKQR
ncbi:MAG: type-F conjugative transfer system secretin TraK [Deltaproteobacteria bacterium]|nr:type-F conjugative transfer system secretin TraK [Deltaproteobacteria bacterium]